MLKKNQLDLQKEIARLDAVIRERYLEDGSSIPEDSLIIADVWLQSDTAYSLFLADDIAERKSEIEDILRGSSKYVEINEVVSVDDAYKEATIRKDFAAALKAVEKGSDLSYTLGYGFWNADLIQLAKMHKANRFRKKIEELLEDCNCHKECDLMHSGDYSKWL